MLNVLSEISWIGVLIGTALNFFLGGLWFAILFAKPYAVALGRENQPKQNPAPIYLIGPLICGLITTLTLAILFKFLKVDSLGNAMSLGALVGLGFLATTTMNTAINPNIPRPLLYGFVSGLFFVLSTISVSIILVTFA